MPGFLLKGLLNPGQMLFKVNIVSTILLYMYMYIHYLMFKKNIWTGLGKYVVIVTLQITPETDSNVIFTGVDRQLLAECYWWGNWNRN